MLCTLQMERLCRSKLCMASHLKMTLYSTLIHTCFSCFTGWMWFGMYAEWNLFAHKWKLTLKTLNSWSSAKRERHLKWYNATHSLTLNHVLDLCPINTVKAFPESIRIAWKVCISISKNSLETKLLFFFSCK